MGYFFMELFNFIILDLIIACEFGNLLVKEPNICLVLTCDCLLFSLYFMEGSMQVFHFTQIHVSHFFQFFLKLEDSCFSFLNPVKELVFHPLVFMFFCLDQFILFFQQFFKFILISPESSH